MNIYKNKLFLACIMPVLAGILVSSLYSDSVFAHTATLTTASSISLNAIPSSSGVSIDEESINVTTTCHAGYNLSVATSTSPDLYLNGDGTSTATFTAVDGTSTLANSTNKWGYTMTSNASASTVFSPLSTTASVLKTPSQTASQTDIDDTFSIYYGTKVADSVTPGSYQMADSGAIVYYLTMDATCTEYIVSFNANGGTGVVANQGIQEGIATKLTSADTLTAPTGASYTDADNNTITGDADKLWTFWGWNTEADGTGDWYKDKESVEDLANVGSTITLYAQWKQATLADLTTSTPVGTEKTIDHNEMQDMSPAACYNSPVTTAANAPAATLLDYRGKVTTGENPEQPEQYTISKLPDNNCWMTKNLNLGRTGTEGPNSDGTITLTSDDTDLAENTTFTLPVSTTTSSTTTTAARIRVTNTSDNNNNGTYYSWPAAIASTAAYTAADVIVTSSVCPKNWDLPTNDQYTNLQTKAAYTSSNTTTSAPSSFLTNGGFTNGATFYQTSYSHFWTSKTAGTYAYGSRANASSISVNSSSGTTYGGDKYYEKNIRCIASNGTVTINYDGNGTTEYPVTGTTASQENVEINSANTQANGFTRTGWAFNGWNTKADGTGTSIAASASIATLNLAPGSTITLYAQWSPALTINFNSNGGTGTMTPQLIPENTSKALKSNSFTAPSGNYFIGWMTEESRVNNEAVYTNGATYTTPTTITPGDSITLYAKWGPRYTIVYNGNSSTGGSMVSSGTELKHTNINEGSTVNLYAPNYWKTNYGFVGWSPSSTATVGGTDLIYGPNETISAPAYDKYGQEISGTKTIPLYAIWLEADSNKTMQTFELADCQNMTQATYDSTTGKITAPAGSVIALKDQRDNNVYTIARLADGKCWMTENLRLEAENTVGNNQYDSSVTNQSLSQNYGGVFTGLDSSENANFTDSTTATPNNLYNSTNITGSYPGYRFPRYNNNNTKTSLTASYNGTGSSTYYSWYSYGNYYTWATAMANTTYYSSATGTSGSESAGTSICPTNWTLPTSGTTTKDFGTLSRSYDGSGENQSGTGTGDIMSNRFRSFPNNFLYSGRFDGSSASNRGSSGYYWSRSASNNGASYNLNLYSTYLNPSNSGTKNYGFSVRCLVGS
ncbi:InlB B-repeat-containing protein [Candidatus Saccharibacteria bacterium]|nr:InlB B-repeat-containing protein [Candidatus Saccharibacteria bacterium]